jgi:exodeoxyribonuclease VIII
MPQSASYRSYFALSYSGIKKLQISPKHFWAWHHRSQEESTTDMTLGTLTHLLLLEPHREATDIAVWTGKVKNGKVWDKFEEDNSNKLIVKPQELEQARRMVASILENPMVKNALRQPSGKAEYEFMGVDEVFEVPVKCGFDWITDAMILDPKKTGGTIKEFEQHSIYKYGYHIQAAFYTRLAKLIDGKDRMFGWIVVEDKEPHECQIVLPHPQHMIDGEAIVDEALAKFMICMRDKQWPGYGEHIKTAELPAWLQKKV